MLLKKVGGFRVREVSRRAFPCYKFLVKDDGRRDLALCLMVDRRFLYLFPFEDKVNNKFAALELKARYLRGQMEHLRLLEVEPGVCQLSESTQQTSA